MLENHWMAVLLLYQRRRCEQLLPCFKALLLSADVHGQSMMMPSSQFLHSSHYCKYLQLSFSRHACYDGIASPVLYLYVGVMCLALGFIECVIRRTPKTKKILVPLVRRPIFIWIFASNKMTNTECQRRRHADAMQLTPRPRNSSGRLIVINSTRLHLKQHIGEDSRRQGSIYTIYMLLDLCIFHIHLEDDTSAYFLSHSHRHKYSRTA